jgi:hypothetical protein
MCITLKDQVNADLLAFIEGMAAEDTAKAV